MIARILRSSAGFPAINYSENKVEQGKASFVQAYNFPFGEDIHDYALYLKKIAECGNDRIKNIQFHATISAEGKSAPKEELQAIAEKWMKKMGYGDQPYLLYFHNDTGNNHVHIISSRVRADGTRINPSFEGERAVRCINEVMQQDLGYKAKVDITAVMKDYQFSTTAQARLLFEQMGWKTSEKNDKLNLIKNGTVQGCIDLQQVKERAKSRIVDEKRKNQLSAILHQYKEGLSLVELQNVLKQKFGIDIIIHQAKGQDKPYGYTLIDNANKSVYKGSEIMPVKELLNPVNRNEKIDAAENIVNLHLDDRVGFSQFRSELYSTGYKLNSKGLISLKGEKTPLFQLDKDVLRKLRYNDRLIEANKFHFQSKLEAGILARLFYVKMNDLINNNDPNKIKTAADYKEMLLSVDGRLNIKQEAKERGCSLFDDGKGHVFLIDKEQHHVVDVSEFERAKDSAPVIDDNRIRYYAESADLDSGFDFFAGLLSVLAIDGNGEEETPMINDRKKKKKQNKIQRGW